jgi:hypothetical protein
MVFNVTLNNFSVTLWRSLFLVEETGVPELTTSVVIEQALIAQVVVNPTTI